MVRVIPDGQVGVGMQLPVQSQSTIYVEPWEHEAGPDELVQVAKTADRIGLFYIGVCDHVAIPRANADAMDTTWYDTMTTLGFLAAATERTRLLTHVAVLPYRHPLITANAVATLDKLSSGRAILGVGAGHVEGEFEALGLPFAERGKMLDECIDVVDLALREEFTSWHGKYFNYDDVAVSPRPVQSPRPPIWVGGWKTPALRRVAERGDGWLPQGVGRDNMRANIAEITRMRAEFGGEPLELGTITEPLYLGEPEFDVGSWALTGSADFVAESLREYVDMGCSHLQVRFRNRTLNELLDQMEAFGAGVLPHLAS